MVSTTAALPTIHGDDSSVPLSSLVRVTKLLLRQDLHEQGILNLLPAD
jgi:hypothetical protein